MKILINASSALNQERVSSIDNSRQSSSTHRLLENIQRKHPRRDNLWFL
jgi:hypothetical protein